MSSSTSANITNLFVNLTFTSSNGMITLINNINGILNIFGYQILGNYVSTLTVAMIGININTASITVNYISFQPSTYNVGNCSSYLFGNASSTTNTFNINNVAVILGNSSNILLLGSISTTSYDADFYLFGGLITYINSASIINVSNIIVDSYQKFSSSYVSQSGFLVGYVKSSLSCVIVQNVCLLQNMTSTTLKFQQFGLIGCNNGNSSIKDASVIFSVLATYFWSLGIIGAQQSLTLADVMNLKTSVNFSTISGGNIGSIIGAEYAKTCQIYNTTVYGFINSGQSSYIGGLIGVQYLNSNMTVQNTIVSQSNISGSGPVGGFAGNCLSSLRLINSKIQFVRISGFVSSVGIVVGINSNAIYSFSGSSSTSNYINGVLQSDCGALSNNWSVAGC
ncbi:Hypothetical_protein [Hexamita inflata]|uniref:Hypothetical_protein n=1 Tax=Hexamita inflata TaxID=28002 RepID=A0AA86PYU2_9EUKA|nr:Hypothetical protein HINF_LOCUS35488 [Hexamita inflata]